MGYEKHTLEAELASSLSLPSGRPRVAFYSHDTYGLGHLRRSLKLAWGLSQQQELPVDMLLISGSPRALSFDLPENLRVVRLPAVTKNSDGEYVSRKSDVPIEETVRVRKAMIRQAVLNFRPDILVVDHAPLGLRGELLPLLGDLRHRTNTQIVLGLRDIMDEPERVIADWEQDGVIRVMESLYHEIWVYGAREVFSLGDMYQMPTHLGRSLNYVGYIGHDASGHKTTTSVVPTLPASLSQGFPDSKRSHLLCLVGGGGDGFPLASSFLRMLEANPHKWNGTLITGPFLSRSKMHRLASGQLPPHVQVLRFAPDLKHLLQGSDAIITMGGYNTLMESISFGRRTLVIPRVFPRKEQLVRAMKFSEKDLLKYLHPDQADAANLTRATVDLLEGPAPKSPSELGIPWDGVGGFVKNILRILKDRAATGKLTYNAERLLRA